MNKSTQSRKRVEDPRLEDNCLVTEDGCENLSRAIPRTIEDIEAVMRKG